MALPHQLIGQVASDETPCPGYEDLLSHGNPPGSMPLSRHDPTKFPWVRLHRMLERISVRQTLRFGLRNGRRRRRKVMMSLRCAAVGPISLHEAVETRRCARLRAILLGTRQPARQPHPDCNESRGASGAEVVIHPAWAGGPRRTAITGSRRPDTLPAFGDGEHSGPAQCVA